MAKNQLNFIDRLRIGVAQRIAPQKNSMSLPQQFLRYGNRGRMRGDWDTVQISDQDIYTGYSFAAIRNRANKASQIANEFLKTKTDKKDFVHPYLATLETSPTFSDFWFWLVVSTYLDLEGVFYLMAIRSVDNGRVGNIKEFKLLNPYTIRRIIDRKTQEVTGYVEARNGYVREFPKEMIIPIFELNPFDWNTPFAMTDAAKENQFTLKTTGDFTRHSLRNNINAPGAISTDVQLGDEEFENFKARITEHTKGEPIFGNGSGAINWQSMQTELGKSGVNLIESDNRDTLFSVYGMSKTLMGIEQSGTTRETSKTQKDLHVEMHTMPRIQLVIDALNQDYKNNKASFKNYIEAEIILDNPLGSDHESELKDAEVKEKQFEVYQTLVDKGYKRDIAADYVSGNISLKELGEPTEEPKKEEPVDDVPPDDKDKKKDNAAPQIVNVYPGMVAHPSPKADNSSDILIGQQEGALQNAIVNVDEKLVAAVMNRIAKKKKNDYESESEIISQTEKNEAINDLMAVLAGFYGITFLLQGNKIMRDRRTAFAMQGDFEIDESVRKWTQQISKKVAKSHVATVLDEVLVVAREAALAGDSIQQVMSKVKQHYAGNIAEARAKAVARTETNRAFTMAQYEADEQFIKQNKLGARAYKRYRTRSAKPCNFCTQLASEGLIPFAQAFRKEGDTVEVTIDGKTETFKVNFETVRAGNLHPNCSCDYDLIIKDEE